MSFTSKSLSLYRVHSERMKCLFSGEVGRPTRPQIDLAPATRRSRSRSSEDLSQRRIPGSRSLGNGDCSGSNWRDPAVPRKRPATHDEEEMAESRVAAKG